MHSELKVSSYNIESSVLEGAERLYLAFTQKWGPISETFSVKTNGNLLVFTSLLMEKLGLQEDDAKKLVSHFLETKETSPTT